MTGGDKERSFLSVISDELRKQGRSENEIQRFQQVYSTNEGSQTFWNMVGLKRGPSEDIVEKFGKSAQDNPLMLDLKDFSRQMVQRQTDLDNRIFDVNTRLSRLEGRFYIITALAIAITATIVGLIFRWLG